MRMNRFGERRYKKPTSTSDGFRREASFRRKELPDDLESQLYSEEPPSEQGYTVRYTDKSYYPSYKEEYKPAVSTRRVDMEADLPEYRKEHRHHVGYRSPEVTSYRDVKETHYLSQEVSGGEDYNSINDVSSEVKVRDPSRYFESSTVDVPSIFIEFEDELTPQSRKVASAEEEGVATDLSAAAQGDEDSGKGNSANALSSAAASAKNGNPRPSLNCICRCDCCDCCPCDPDDKLRHIDK